MPRYEYKVVPAPRKGVRAKGMRGVDQKFANALQGAMNLQAADGWEYLRTDTLPCEERHGLSGKTTVFQNMLVFRRPVADDAAPDTAPMPETEPTTLAPRPVRLDPPIAAPQATMAAEAEDGQPDIPMDGADDDGPGSATGRQPT
jgi:hypothetical protein